MAYFNILSWHLPEGTGNENEKSVMIGGLWVEILTQDWLSMNLEFSP